MQCALAAVQGTKKNPYFYYKYQALKKRRSHKKAIIAIARKMLVAIYHMIRDDADFLPVNHEETVACSTKAGKGLNLTNIIEFLGEHGADAETLQLIKDQCSQSQETGTGKARIQETMGKEKQPISDTVHQDNPGQEPAQKKDHSKSCQTEQKDSSGMPVPTTATA